MVTNARHGVAPRVRAAKMSVRSVDSSAARADLATNGKAPAMAAQTAPAGCPVAGASMLTTQQLRAMLDARYLYRVGLPR